MSKRKGLTFNPKEFKNEIAKRLPPCLPIEDYNQPHDKWTQSMFNDNYRFLVVHPVWAFLHLLQIKCVENRSVACSWSGKPVIVKASKEQSSSFTITDIEDKLNQPGVRNQLKKYHI